MTQWNDTIGLCGNINYTAFINDAATNNYISFDNSLLQFNIYAVTSNAIATY